MTDRKEAAGRAGGAAPAEDVPRTESITRRQALRLCGRAVAIAGAAGVGVAGAVAAEPSLPAPGEILRRWAGLRAKLGQLRPRLKAAHEAMVREMVTRRRGRPSSYIRFGPDGYPLGGPDGKAVRFKSPELRRAEERHDAIRGEMQATERELAELEAEIGMAYGPGDGTPCPVAGA